MQDTILGFIMQLTHMKRNPEYTLVSKLKSKTAIVASKLLNQGYWSRFYGVKN